MGRELVPQPQRIGLEHVQHGLRGVVALDSHIQETDGRPANWQDYREILTGFNPAVVALLDESIRDIQTNAERLLVTRAVYALYFAAKAAHDPNSRMEYADDDFVQMEENERVQVVEQITT
jgi:hypothetical protein